MKNKNINIDPEILGGTPVFSGTRVPIQSLFDWLETETLENFLTNFPGVKLNQALDVLSHAEELIINKAMNESIFR